MDLPLWGPASWELTRVQSIKSYYAKGYVEGKAESLGGTDISYVYHKHIGSPSQEGGCYTKAV